MKKIAVFPGSFDPITRGHESIIRRALPVFDEIIVALGENAEKKSYFPLDSRLKWLELVFGDEPKVRIVKYSGLTVDLCTRMNAGYILRGLRTSADDFRLNGPSGYDGQAISPAVKRCSFTVPGAQLLPSVHRWSGISSATAVMSVTLSLNR